MQVHSSTIQNLARKHKNLHHTKTRPLHYWIILKVFLGACSKGFNFITPCKALDWPSARLDKRVLRQIFVVSTDLTCQGEIQQGKAIGLHQCYGNSCHTQLSDYPQLRFITGAGGLPVHTTFLPAHLTPATWGSHMGSLPNAFMNQVMPWIFCLAFYISLQLPLAQPPAGTHSNWTAKYMFVACIPFHGGCGQAYSWGSTEGRGFTAESRVLWNYCHRLNWSRFFFFSLNSFK